MAVITINGEADFDRRMSAANGKAVFVDFTASWCGPCQHIAPYFHDLASQNKGSVFLKVDVDQCRDVASRYGVNAMPTFIAFVNGQKKATIQGADVDGLREMVSRYGSTNVAFSGSGQRLSSATGSSSSSSNSGPRNAPPTGGAPGPNPLEGVNQVIESINARLRGYGFTDINAGGFTIQPSHILIAIALLFLIGPFGLVIGVAICFFTQPGGAAARPPQGGNTGGSGPSGGARPQPSSPRAFGGAGQRLGGN